MTKLILSLTLLHLCACHPLSMFKPKPIKRTNESSVSGLKKSIEVAVDAHSIPFIKADTINNVIYGLGFMHARDRLFQLDLIRHAALGRVAELFGDKALALDRRLRILSYRLDEQLAHLSDEEQILLDNYVRGINDSAKQRGRSAEHFLLGVAFEEFTKQHVIAIARLQSWQLGADLFAEISRLKIARSNLSQAAKSELLSALDDRDTAIVNQTKISIKPHNLVLPSYIITSAEAANNRTTKTEDEPVQFGTGASNAWAINGQLAKEGHAMLMNDPHLQHSWPSNFYLATLMSNDLFVTGATFVGLPGILIGASNHLSWGVTASCLNTQDAVLLKMVNAGLSYEVDGRTLALKEWPQQYCLNKKGKCIKEMKYVSLFGPTIDHGFDRWVDSHDNFAVQWTGFNVEQHRHFGLGFIKLAQAKNVAEGIKVIKSMTLPGVNMIIADTFGHIGYAYAGLVPKRDTKQHPYLPLDGRVSSSLWAGFLTTKQKPILFDPASGFIVTANQNIYSKYADDNLVFGKQGAPPYRALRIKERIFSMINTDKAIDFTELSSIQLDETSIEAKELSPLIGSICRKSFANANDSRKQFGTMIATFDGRYTIDSLGALPYEFLMRQIISDLLKDSLGEYMPDGMAYISQIRYGVKNALLKQLTGEKTAVFADHSSADGAFDNFMSQACEQAYQNTVKKAGKSPWQWRWGRHHFLQRQSPLAKAPLIGGLFRDKKREVAGITSSPMAETGTPVLYGANLRFRANMTTPPQIYAVLDSGNSGTVGHHSAFDQAKLWHEGKSIAIETNWEQALENSANYFVLNNSHHKMD